MTDVYVREQGAMVRKRGERMVVSKQGTILDEFPLNKVQQVVLLGNVQISTQTMVTLAQRSIDLVFMSSYGKFRFRLVSDESKRVSLRHRQLVMAGDEQAVLAQAKAIVTAKIHNQRVLLQRQARRITSGQGQQRGAVRHLRDRGLFDRSLAGMKQMQQQAGHATSVESVRGYEGKAAVYYFQAVRSLLDPAWGFAKREYYPPPDPFNALLSFTYSLVLKDVRAAIQLVGLDLYLGFFHEIRYNRPSLALDLMEEWRPLIADALSLQLVNQGRLLPEQFTWTNNPNRPVELGEAGVELVLESYGRRLSTTLHHPLAGPGGETTLQRAIVLQARRMARVVAGKDPVYTPMQAK
jgi:CRISPR-associated protein Cas1